MKQKYFEKKQDTYNPPTPIVINNNHKIEFSTTNTNSHNGHNVSKTKTLRSPHSSPRHYPVYPFDKQPLRAQSPVRLSSIVLAKEPPIEIKTQDEEVRIPEPQVEIEQPKKIKTIMSTQRRKESAPSLTGWRTESDSDTEIQNRLLAKASGSIPIEYISIRRDPKPSEKKPEKSKKSITTGTNTCVERGKRIASTNTNQDELPQYNLHVSLDSLFVKSRREASTSVERQIKNAATETEVKQKDAFTVTDVTEVEPPPQPPSPLPQPPQEHYIYRSRKSRFTEWETASNPPADNSHYKLEFLTKSPRTLHRRCSQTQFQTKFQNTNEYEFGDVIENNSLRHRVPSLNSRKVFYEEVRADDDDKLIFGSTQTYNQQYNESFQSNHHQQQNQSFYNRRSGSFPNLMASCRPQVLIDDNSGSTRRYVKHTQSTSYAPPPPFIPVSQQYELSFMPLKQSNGCINTSSDAWGQQFNQFNSKFNEIFGQRQHVDVIQPVEQGKTERLFQISNDCSTFRFFFLRNMFYISN